MEMSSLLIKLEISWLNSYNPFYQVFHHSEKIIFSVQKWNVYGLIVMAPLIIIRLCCSSPLLFSSTSCVTT